MRTDRRTFLAIAGAMLAGAAASPAHAEREPDGSGRSLTPDPPVPALDTPGMRVLHFASLAPNGHNTQPWSVVVHDARHWTIRAVPSRRLPAVDPHDRELTLSIGAFVENLVLAAAAEGRHSCRPPVGGRNAAAPAAGIRGRSPARTRTCARWLGNAPKSHAARRHLC